MTDEMATTETLMNVDTLKMRKEAIKDIVEKLKNELSYKKCDIIGSFGITIETFMIDAGDMKYIMKCCNGYPIVWGISAYSSNKMIMNIYLTEHLGFELIEKE